MTARPLAVLCAVLFMPVCALSASSWSGYINDKSSPGQRYGYIESVSSHRAGDSSKLRLTCYPPQGFRVYVDEKLFEQNIPSRVTIKVDKLPALVFQLYQHDRRYFITDQAPNFWDLIAQMIAGGSLIMTLGESSVGYQFQLNGFTAEFTQHCGWMPHAENYRSRIGKYK